ncbi:MAG: YdbH domain-containing protein [Bdellovibrionales bacterium]
MISLFQRHKFGCALIALAVLLALIAAALPWKLSLENRLKGLLEAQGFTNVRLTLFDISPTRLMLKDIAFKNNDLGITARDATTNGALQATDKRWDGQWEVKDIQITKANTPFPVFNGKGSLSLQFDKTIIKGQFRAADTAAQLTFESTALFGASKKSTLIVTDFSMPWSGGTLSAQNIKIPFVTKFPIDINLKIDQVSADALMQQLTGKRATATGKISGILPMTLASGDSIVFCEGQLQADAPGTLALSPDVIPGDNPQVALVREILKDFHYTSLTLNLNSGKDNRTDVRLSLEGKNPQVQQGRSVKMNVTLNGDVLGFAQQNLLWLTDPKKIMEQEKNAKP